MSLEHGLNLIQSPGQISLFDDQRWRKSNDGVVGLLAEQTAILEGFAERPGGNIQFDGQPQAFPSHGFYQGILHLLEASQRVFAERSGAAAQVLVHDDFQCGTATAQASGFPPKVLPWSPGWKTPSTARELSTADTG